MAAPEIAKEGEVLVLTEDTFQAAIDSHEFILVDFYASWCPPCQRLAPVYTQAAAALAGKGSAIKLAKVDAEAEQALAERFEIEGFPTLKYFRSGEPIEYEGGRTEEAIVAWVERKSGPAAAPLTSVEEAEAFLSGKDAAVVGFFPDQSSEAATAYCRAAGAVDEIPFAITSSQEVADHYKMDIDTVVLIKSSDSGHVVLSEAITEEAVKKFVLIESLPLVLRWSQEIAGKMFDGHVKSHLLVLLSEKSETYDAEIEMLKAVATDAKGKMLVVTVITDDTEDDGHTRIMRMLDIKESELPTFRAIKLGEDLEKYIPEDPSITAENVKNFVAKFLAGELKPHLKTEEVPEDWDKKGTKVLVGRNFQEVAMDTEKNVLVDFYADWCPPCQKLAPTIEELGERFADHPRVIIAKMDACANEVAEVKISSYPTIKLVKAGTNQIIDFDGDRTLEGFVNFLKEQTGETPVEA